MVPSRGISVGNKRCCEPKGKVRTGCLDRGCGREGTVSGAISLRGLESLFIFCSRPGLTAHKSTEHQKNLTTMELISARLILISCSGPHLRYGQKTGDEGPDGHASRPQGINKPRRLRVELRLFTQRSSPLHPRLRDSHCHHSQHDLRLRPAAYFHGEAPARQ